MIMAVDWNQVRENNRKSEVEIVPEAMITPATPGWGSFGGEDPSGLYIQIPEPPR